MGVCRFVLGGVLSTGTYVPDGVDGNPNIKILVWGFCWTHSHRLLLSSYPALLDDTSTGMLDLRS